MSPNDRILTLERLIAKYEKSRTDFAAINEELRTLSRRSAKLEEVLALNSRTLEITERLLQTARERLEKEKSLAAQWKFSDTKFEAA